MADKGLRKSWTIDLTSAAAATFSLTTLFGLILSFPFVGIVLRLGEVFPQEFDQFTFRMESGLLPGVHFLNQAFHLAAGCRLPELNYERSSHDEFRISGSCARSVEISWS